MRKFTDRDEREWTIEIDLALIRRVRDDVQVNLFEHVEPPGFALLAQDPLRLVDALYAALRPQADAAQLDATGFARAMSAGGVIEAAGMELWRALADFFPSPRRENLLRLIDAGAQLEQTGRELATLQMERAIANRWSEYERLRASFPQNSNEHTTASPESADSTLTASPSANSP